jgi:hypothetical protein
MPVIVRFSDQRIVSRPFTIEEFEATFFDLQVFDETHMTALAKDMGFSELSKIDFSNLDNEGVLFLDFLTKTASCMSNKNKLMRLDRFVIGANALVLRDLLLNAEYQSDQERESLAKEFRQLNYNQFGLLISAAFDPQTYIIDQEKIISYQNGDVKTLITLILGHDIYRMNEVGFEEFTNFVYQKMEGFGDLTIHVSGWNIDSSDLNSVSVSGFIDFYEKYEILSELEIASLKVWVTSLEHREQLIKTRCELETIIQK